MNRFLAHLLLAVLTLAGTVGTAAAARGWPDIALIEWQPDGPAEDGFRQGIQNTYPEARFWVYNAGGNPAVLADLIRVARQRDHDLYYVSGTPATRMLLRGINQRPVIFTMVQDPVAEGLIASWRSSENNATGVSNRVPIINQLKALKKIVPFRRLGVVYDPRDPDALQQVAQLARLQHFLKFELHRLPASSLTDLEALALPGNPPLDALFIPSDPLLQAQGRTLLDRANQTGIPTLAADLNQVTQRGALLGLVPDNYQIGRLAANSALTTLAGTPPAAIPSLSLDFFLVVLNMRTARTLGVQVPLSLLVIADTILR
jgi:putative ABC transport system substrate-binding protein